jgi:hypothetical protein
MEKQDSKRKMLQFSAILADEGLTKTAFLVHKEASCETITSILHNHSVNPNFNEHQ